ncbi:FecR domain-containing protein [Xylophilus sp. ASV27]|uniref:FecR domain-containing protein n=1 Tax=Xylophilus sp. ASV27 TaxID=2795129 RepID=UPI0018EDA927
MPGAGGVSGPAAVAPDAAVLRDAAQWLVRLHSGHADAADRAACDAWRRADPEHERAWQRAERLAQKFGAVPAAVGVPVLARAQHCSRRAALRMLALLTTAAPAAWIGWRLAPPGAWTSDYRTATGERRALELEDGSRVLLDTGSAIDVRFDGARRVVRLRAGAISVVTAPDRRAPGPARPFIVATAQGRLRALGTRFTVRQDGDERDHARRPEVRLAVTEGAVEVTLHGASAPALIVPAGRQAVLSGQGAFALQDLSPESQAWVQGVLHAENLRLIDFCAELSRYRPGLLHCAPDVANLRISGVFQLRDTDYALSMVASTLPVRIVTRTRWWVMVVPA